MPTCKYKNTLGRWCWENFHIDDILIKKKYESYILHAKKKKI